MVLWSGKMGRLGPYGLGATSVIKGRNPTAPRQELVGVIYVIYVRKIGGTREFLKAYQARGDAFLEQFKGEHGPSSAGLSIAMGAATPARAKPDLPMWASLKDRIRRKLVHMTKVGTDAMPVDFMTKWLKGSVMESQLAYLINARHAVWPA